MTGGWWGTTENAKTQTDASHERPAEMRTDQLGTAGGRGQTTGVKRKKRLRHGVGPRPKRRTLELTNPPLHYGEKGGLNEPKRGWWWQKGLLRWRHTEARREERSKGKTREKVDGPFGCEHFREEKSRGGMPAQINHQKQFRLGGGGLDVQGIRSPKGIGITGKRQLKEGTNKKDKETTSTM